MTLLDDCLNSLKRHFWRSKKQIVQLYTQMNLFSVEYGIITETSFTWFCFSPWWRFRSLRQLPSHSTKPWYACSLGTFSRSDGPSSFQNFRRVTGFTIEWGVRKFAFTKFSKTRTGIIVAIHFQEKNLLVRLMCVLYFYIVLWTGRCLITMHSQVR